MLQTDRLHIIPLTTEQFRLLLDGNGSMELTLGLERGAGLDSDTQEAMEGLYSQALQNPDRHVWYTNWQIILRAENRPIGSACFVGEPNSDGEAEVGYGIDEAYRGQGYMQEALAAMCHWALSQRGVTAVTAGTEKDNPASQRVLEKCGMVFYREANGCLWWRLDRATVDRE